MWQAPDPVVLQKNGRIRGAHHGLEFIGFRVYRG